MHIYEGPVGERNNPRQGCIDRRFVTTLLQNPQLGKVRGSPAERQTERLICMRLVVHLRYTGNEFNECAVTIS